MKTISLVSLSLFLFLVEPVPNFGQNIQRGMIPRLYGRSYTIEADVEVINLTRFELYIPEKRPFFLEGSERYSQRIRQFYSRRIGDISWGAKTNGKLGGTDFSAIATSADYTDEDGIKAMLIFKLLQSDIAADHHIMNDLNSTIF